jgi:hypothetical protein
METAVRKPKLWGKITSNADDLDKLQPFYPWIPGSSTIRPTQEDREAKARRLEEITSTYESFVDYILHSVFEREAVEREGKLAVLDRSMDTAADEERFVPNIFPYAVPSNHFVMWFSAHTKHKNDEDITSKIAESLQSMHGGTDAGLDFVWYENPKMSVPEIYHVQVFWIKH